MIAAFLASGILAALGQIATAGFITPALATALATLIPSILSIVVTSNDYYAINQQSGSFSKNWVSDTYYILTVNTSDKNLQFDLQISYTYSTTETVTRYRTETRYREVTKYSDETRYRDVTSYREEIRYSQTTRILEGTQERSQTEFPYLPLLAVGLVGLVALGGWQYISTRPSNDSFGTRRKILGLRPSWADDVLSMKRSVWP